MKDFDSLKNIWNQQEVKPPVDVEALISKAKRIRREYSSKIMIKILALSLSVVTIIWLFFNMKFESPLTYIGMGLMSVTIVSFIFLSLWHFLFFNTIDFTENPTNTLKKLEKVYSFQKLLKTKLFFIYAVVLSIGLGMYFIEVTASFSLAVKLSVYGSTFLWFLISYFYIGKRQAAKEEKRLQIIIDAIKKIDIGNEY